MAIKYILYYDWPILFYYLPYALRSFEWWAAALPFSTEAQLLFHSKTFHSRKFMNFWYLFHSCLTFTVLFSTYILVINYKKLLWRSVWPITLPCLFFINCQKLSFSLNSSFKFFICYSVTPRNVEHFTIIFQMLLAFSSQLYTHCSGFTSV